MSGPATIAYPSYGSSTPSSPPLIWTRRARSGANILIVSDDQIVVGIVPNSKLKAAREQLEAGQGVYDVVGPKSESIALHAVQTVTAKLNTTEIEIHYDKGGRRVAKQRFVMPDSEAQADALLAIRDRMNPAPEVVEKTASRLFYTLKPFNFLLIFGFLAAGAQTYYKTTVFDRKANAARLQKLGGSRQHSSFDSSGDSDSGYSYTGRRAPRWMTRNLGATRVVVLAAVVIGLVAVILNVVGYEVTMTVLLGGTLLCFLWMSARLLNPPKTMSLVATGRRLRR